MKQSITDRIEKLERRFTNELKQIKRDLEVEQQKPEFKVGDWVIGVKNFRPFHPVRITKIKKRIFYWKAVDNTECDNSWKSSLFDEEVFIRLATHDEIENHLIEEAKKRGFKNGCFHKDNLFFFYHLYYSPILEYRLNGDFLMNGNNFIIYENGKWAEVIEEKKELPKTVEELKQFMTDFAWYQVNYKDPDYSVKTFLKERKYL